MSDGAIGRGKDGVAMIDVMGETTTSDLESRGRNMAELVSREGGIEQVEVTPGADRSGRSTYNFAVLIDKGHARERRGLLYLRLHQKLKDALMARGEIPYPVIHILDHTDWARRKIA